MLFLAALIFAGGTVAVFLGPRGATPTAPGIALNPEASASRLEIFEQQTATPAPTPVPSATPWFPSPSPTIDPALITPDPFITPTPTATQPGQITPRPTRTPRPAATPTKTPKPTNNPTPPPADSDGDGRADAVDNCPNVKNANQANMDGDEFGDKCDDDRDGDGVANGPDNCPNVHNPGQADNDEDGMGNLCDESPDPTNTPEPTLDPDGDADGDGVPNGQDDCPNRGPEDGQVDPDNNGCWEDPPASPNTQASPAAGSVWLIGSVVGLSSVGSLIVRRRRAPAKV